MIRLLTKMAILAAILIVVQLTLGYASGFKETPATVRALEDSLASGVDVLYLGDSTLYRGDPSESDQRTLPEMVGDLLPEKRVASVYHDAYNLELFEYFIRRALQEESPPEVIVIPINMRNFSVERVKRPEYQFVREKLFLENTGPVFRAMFRPLAVFKAFDLEPISEAEYLQIVNHDGDRELGTFAHFRSIPFEEGLPLHVRACYRYDLTPGHPHVQALDRIAAMCDAADVRLVVYATPTDFERGEEIIGEDFSEGIRANLQVIESVLDAHGIDMIGMTFDYGAEHFATDYYPDAYIRSEAKQDVADAIAEACY